jgi:hypothetical protein
MAGRYALSEERTQQGGLGQDDLRAQPLLDELSGRA